jgi:hypothetical protein
MVKTKGSKGGKRVILKQEQYDDIFNHLCSDTSVYPAEFNSWAPYVKTRWRQLVKQFRITGQGEEAWPNGRVMEIQTEEGWKIYVPPNEVNTVLNRFHPLTAPKDIVGDHKGIRRTYKTVIYIYLESDLRRF